MKNSKIGQTSKLISAGRLLQKYQLSDMTSHVGMGCYQFTYFSQDPDMLSWPIYAKTYKRLQDTHESGADNTFLKYPFMK